MSTAPMEVIVLELVAVADPIVRAHGERFRRPSGVRLRAALKVLLRQYGLRCVAARNAPADEITRQDSTPGGEATHAG